MFNSIQPSFSRQLSIYLMLSLTSLLSSSWLSAQTISWDFTTANTSTNTSTSTVSAMTAGQQNGSTTLISSTSASSGYAGSSGGNNAGAAALTGAFNAGTSTYFQFTITPTSGTVVTLTGISFGTRSTSTAPQAYSLRASTSSYGTDLASGTISATSVWALKSHTGLSAASVAGTAITFRIYGYNGTGSPGASTANWRIDDLILTVTESGGGPTAPILASPSSASITESSATLGATVASDGGNSLTERGTVFNTVTGVTATDNPLAEGGTAVSAFTHSRTGLSPQTLYYYKGYGINANGTGLSSEATFRTLSNPPTAQASGFSGTAANGGVADFTWTAASFPGSGATATGYVLLRATSPNTPSLSNSNGAAPVAGANTTIVSSSILGSATTASATGLSGGTTYNFMLVPYTWDGTNASTYNYMTAGAPTTSATVPTTTYTFIGTGTAAWTTASNWSPNGVPSNGDAVIFNDPNSVVISGLPTTLTLSGFSVTDGAQLTFLMTSPLTSTLTLSGGTAPQLNIDANSSIGLTGTGATIIALSAGTSGSISGAIVADGPHKVTAASAGGLVFNDGGSFTTWTGFTGNAFGNTTANSVVFNAGSSYIHRAGSNPFALSAPASVVTFNTGSNFVVYTGSTFTPSASGRTYANLLVQNSTTVSASGSSNFQCDTLNVAAGSSFTFSGSGTNTITVRGDIISAGTGSITLTSGSGGVVFNKTGTQNIGGGGGSGTISINNLMVNAGTTVNLFRNITNATSSTVNGTLNFGTFNLTGTGAFTANADATLGIGSASGIAASGATGNVQTSGTRTFNGGANYVYNGSSNQATGTGLPGTVKTLTIANTGAGAIVTLSASTGVSSATAAALSLESGFLEIGSGLTLTMGTGSGLSANLGDLAPASLGTLAFSGNNVVAGTTVNFYPTTTLAGGVNFNAGMCTIMNEMQLNAGGYVDTNAPTYDAASTLIYSTGGTYGRFTEWNATNGVGYPGNVKIQNNTTLDLSANGSADRACAGNLEIEAGSSLDMGNMSNKLSVAGNLTLNGTLSLSSAIGGDFAIFGNWTRNAGGVFNSNNRAVFFEGSNAAGIFDADDNAQFDYLYINKTGGADVDLASVTTVNANLTLNAMLHADIKKIVIPASATVTRNSGFINGEEEMGFAEGSNVTRLYDIGNETVYAPISVTINTVSGAGFVAASTTASDHPELASSGFNADNTVNRFWTLTNNGVAYDNFNATAIWDPSEEDAGFSIANIFGGNYYGATWFYPTSASYGANSGTAQNMTAFGDLQFGSCSAPTLSATVTNATCSNSSDGAIDLGVSGTPVLSYTWSNGATTEDLSNVAAGDYTVTVVGVGGCEVARTETVGADAVASTTYFADTDGDTYGDAAASQLACSAPTNYVTDNTDCDDTKADVYPNAPEFCDDEDDNCDGTVDETTLAATYNAVNTNCSGASGGLIFVNATGGVPTFSYLWDNGATTSFLTGLSAGTYMVTVTDTRNCTLSNSFTITTPAPLAVAILQSVAVKCYGDSNGKLVAAPSGGTGAYRFEWSNGVQTQINANIPSGSYTVTLTDLNGNCTTSATVTLADPPAVEISGITSTQTSTSPVRYSATVAATGGTGALKYRRSTTTGYTGWSSSNVLLNIPGGTFTFVVKDSKNCATSVSQAIPVTAPKNAPATPSNLGQSMEDRHEASAQIQFALLPNPATDYLLLSMTENSAFDGEILVMDALNRVVSQQSVNLKAGEQKRLDLSNFAAGNYALVLRPTEGGFQTRKFTVVK